MKNLLFAYYVKFDRKNIDFIILLLIHELRIMSINQMYLLINQEISTTYKSISRRLKKLRSEELIDCIVDSDDNRKKYYFLTRSGYNSIGGFYSLPKVPEYNLNHHLMVTDYLIETLEMVIGNDHFLFAKTERRQTYEIKDLSQSKKGTMYHVADYIVSFEAKNKTTIEWHFEIELTMKSKKRYISAIFPKYLNLLSKKKNARLLYVTPSRSIQRELESFKIYFISKKKKGDFPAMDIECFDRFHIISSDDFERQLQDVLLNEPHIHW